MTLAELNQLNQAQFADALGAIFEHSPWIPEQTWPQRPFESAASLHAALCATMCSASRALQLGLIRAHPQLAGKAALRGELTEHSREEQAGAGLAHCSPDEYALLHARNDAYQARFGFPFILAVRGHTRQSILEQMAARLHRGDDAEFVEALRQISEIARFRLSDSIKQATS